tara:strand:+ start:736 stop:909 length:174 start_codon:yes stop_codon:yes gene_type:complete
MVWVPPGLGAYLILRAVVKLLLLKNGRNGTEGTANYPATIVHNKDKKQDGGENKKTP